MHSNAQSDHVLELLWRDLPARMENHCYNHAHGSGDQRDRASAFVSHASDSKDGSPDRQRQFVSRTEIPNKEPPNVQKRDNSFAKTRSRNRAAIFKLARGKEKSPLPSSQKENRPPRSRHAR